jgi:hypothetical protein
MDNKEIVVRTISDQFQDSLEIGSPSKGGVIKVYGNFADKEAFKAKIDAAAYLRSYALERLGTVSPPKEKEGFEVKDEKVTGRPARTE